MKGRRRKKNAAHPLNRQQVIRMVAVTGGISLLVFAIGVWSLLTVIDQTTRDSNQTIHALADSLTQNQAKLVSVGEKPVGPPAEQIIGDQGPPGPAGAEGPVGQSGSTGPAGRDGRDATPAQVAAAVRAYMEAHPVKGATGTAGRDGRDGAAGADGQSPACLAEPDQCRGATGQTGATGERGAGGADGQPPSAWTWTDPVTRQRYDCRRDSGSPDSTPAYTCSPS